MTAPTAGWFDGREHVLPVRVYYEDTDFSGLVYHGSYVRFYERGRSDFLRSVGVHHAELAAGEDPTAFIVTRLAIDFRTPARIDDALEVRTLYESAKGPRLAIRQRILRGEALVAEADIEAACINLSGRPRKPPPGLVEKLRPWFATPP
jgi:acyl-CoA thioester hydrolase